MSQAASSASAVAPTTGGSITNDSSATRWLTVTGIVLAIIGIVIGAVNLIKKGK